MKCICSVFCEICVSRQHLLAEQKKTKQNREREIKRLRNTIYNSMTLVQNLRSMKCGKLFCLVIWLLP